MLSKRPAALVFICGERRLGEIRGRDSRPHGVHFSVEFDLIHVALPNVRRADRPELDLRDALRCGSALASLVVVSQFGI
jgi:hypothetical protein